ncbi:CPBP family intramembrane glutamic endopeptidase [Glutamicibacter protophormiae]|uniref:CPBP family intramembrane glutamic endopeptidase n=1 Tax=Glutamicibacter protophormiae TaxID=37930 RepID=UPI003A9466DD
MSNRVSAPRIGAAGRALLLAAVTAALTVTGAVLIPVIAPGLDSRSVQFVDVLVMASFTLIVVLLSRHRHLLWSGSVNALLIAVPAVVVLSPFVGGLKDLGPSLTLMFIVGYIATGINEEFWFRGLMLGALSTWPPMCAAALSSALFGLAHLSNLVFGANLWITLAQVVGAACFGFGFAALRLRGTSIWVLAALHAVADIALQLGDVSSAWRWGLMVGGDVVLLVFGVIAIRRLDAARATEAGAAGRRDAERISFPSSSSV